jgi:hypothetical protein
MKTDPEALTPLSDTDINWGDSSPPSPDWHAAPASRFRGTNPVPGSQAKPPQPAAAPLPLTSMRDLLAEVDETVDYLVDGLIQTASVNVLGAKPKVGKSTFARHLSLAVARGEDSGVVTGGRHGR